MRNLFEWLPSFIVSVVESFNARPIRYTNGRRVLASEFEMYIADTDPLGEKRYPLSPALTFATAEEAALALVESLGQLLTGEDLVESIHHA